MRRSVSFALATLLVLAFASPAAAGSTGWKIYTYNPSGNALSSHQADAGPSFTFTSTTDTALFATQRPEGPNVSLAGRTISATFRIDAGGATFHYYGEGTCGSTPASVRLYFSSNGSMGTNKDWYSNFWWSNPVSQVLADGEFTLTTKVDPAKWSNWNGQFGTDRPIGFAAAAADPDLVGFSFGGGCYFENGVGATGGTATFTLVGITILPPAGE